MKEKVKRIVFISTLVVVMVVLLIAINLLGEQGYFGSDRDDENSKEINQTQTIVNVIDGDTFEYNGKIIRLLCIDAPEISVDGGDIARNYLQEMIYGREIRLENESLDSYNRTLAYVYVNISGREVFVNKEMIDKKFASLFVYNNTDCSALGIENEL